MTMPTITLPASGTWTFDPSHTTVGFVARHLMVTKVRGSFGAVTGIATLGERPEDSTVDVSIATASITTGWADRDAHLRSPDFFDVDSYPEMRFVSTAVERAGHHWLMRGNLTIKGVTRPVTLEMEFDGVAVDPWGKPHAAFTARAEIDREDWGLNWNVALETGGWLVSKKIAVEIETQLIPAG